MKKVILILIGMISCSLWSVEFDIEKFSRPNKYGWENSDQQLKARENRTNKQQLLQIYNLKNQDIPSNMIKSAIVPGWGHFIAGKPTTGTVLLGTEIILMGTSIYFYDKAMDNYDKYKGSNYIADIKQFYNDANSPYTYSQILFSLGVTVWLYSIYDTISVTDEYNKDLWQTIILEYQTKKIQITPTSITLRF